MTQATISNYGTFDNNTLQATVGSTSKLTGGALYGASLYSEQDGHSVQRYLDVDGDQIDTDLQKAIIRGFATSESMNISTQLAWTCPTGNCTWPVYASLAVCSECYDVSNLLRSSSINGSWPMAYRDQSGGLPLDPRAKLTQYTLPYANLTIDNWEGYRNATGQNVSSEPTAYMVAKSEMQSNNTIYFKGYESLLMSFSTIKADTGYMSNLSMWQDERPAAMECGLFLCLQAYKTTVESGKLVETIVATTRRKTPRSWHITEGMSSTDSTALGALNWNPINSNEFDPRTDFQLDASDLNISFPGANGAYNATQTLLYSMVDYLNGLLTPENDFNVLDVDYAVVYDKSKTFLGRKTIRQYTTSTIQSLYLSSHLDETFLGVANSMTSYFRNAGTHTQKGSVQHWTIHYKIRWPFIALPVFVVFGGAILLGVSIFQTYEQGMAVWRDNIIAAMVYSVNPNTRSQLRQMLRYRRLDDVGDLVVHMHELEDGVELSTAPDPDVMRDDNIDRSSMSSSRRVSNIDSLVPSTSQIEPEDQGYTSSQALVSPISTTTLTNTPH
ncbi:hypothetical protein KCU95_g6847, partial [Aureobasidium melanogenum]